MRAQPPWEDLIPETRNWKARLQWPAVFQRPPAFVGEPANLASGLGPHTLAVVIPFQKRAELQGVDAEHIVTAVWGYVHQLSIIADPDFLKDWVLVLGTREMFATQGMILDKDYEPGAPAVVSRQLAMPHRRTKAGAQGYGELEELSHKLVGAQLYRLDRLLQRAINQHFAKRSGAPPARNSIEPHLEPFLQLTRGGHQADPGKLYTRLVGLGRAFLAELHGDADALMARLEPAEFPSSSRIRRADDLVVEIPALRHELALLESCINIATRAREIHEKGYGPLRFNTFFADSRVTADLTPGIQNALLGRSGDNFPTPSILQLTELAYRYRINPSMFFPALNSLDLHFRCAELIGDDSRGEDLPNEPHWDYWGLKGLIRSVHDGWLAEDIRISRAVLRARLTPRLLDLAELPGIYASEPPDVQRPIWTYRTSVRR